MSVLIALAQILVAWFIAGCIGCACAALTMEVYDLFQHNKREDGSKDNS